MTTVTAVTVADVKNLKGSEGGLRSLHLAERAIPLTAILPAMLRVSSLAPDVVRAHVVVVVWLVHTLSLVHAPIVSRTIHHQRRVVLLIDVERRELPAEDVVRLPVLIPGSGGETHVCAAVVKLESEGQVDGSGDDGRVHVVHVHVQQAHAGAPVSLSTIREVSILSGVTGRGSEVRIKR